MCFKWVLPDVERALFLVDEVQLGGPYGVGVPMSPLGPLDLAGSPGMRCFVGCLGFRGR